MNLSKSFISLSVLLTIIKQSVSEEVLVRRNSGYAPLALIKKGGSPLLELAKPHKYLGKSTVDVAEYFYDTSEINDAPKEEFLVACAAGNNERKRDIAAEWKKSNNYKPKDSGKLLFQEQYEKMCSDSAAPLVKKTEKTDERGRILYCGESEAEIYQVGYAVSNEDGTDIQFISIYEICHSTTLAKVKEHQGTLYAIHRIDSPSLLLTRLEDGTEPSLKFSFQSFLDGDRQKLISFYERYHVHQFVGTYDMPTKLWEYTTLFPFNYTPITSNPKLYKGMLEVDDYIRLFSKQNDTPLKLYSGVHETKKIIRSFPCVNACTKEVTVKLFWRIIINMKNEAIMVVTQHTPESCNQTYICQEGRVKVKNYRKGGCIYMCTLNNSLTILLGLPPLNIRGSLMFTIPRLKNKSSKGTNNIRNFVGHQRGGFSSGLRTVDPVLANTLAPVASVDGGHSHGFFGFGDGGGVGGGGDGGGGDGGGGADFGGA